MINSLQSTAVFFSFVGILALIFLIIGSAILIAVEVETCPSQCIEKRCLTINNKYYPCDCGNSCQPKETMREELFGLGGAILSIGFIGMITSCVGLIFYKNRSNHSKYQPPITADSNQNIPVTFMGPVMVIGQPVDYRIVQPTNDTYGHASNAQPQNNPPNIFNSGSTIPNETCSSLNQIPYATQVPLYIKN